MGGYPEDYAVFIGKVLKRTGIRLLFFLAFVCALIFYLSSYLYENRLLKQIIERLTAESRIAQVLVSDVRTEPLENKTYTTIKFLEYDARLKPLEPKYFTFSGNLIQFQSLVIRFDDFYVKKAHPLKGRSAYLFMKVFALTDKGAEVFDINKINEAPSGYKIPGARPVFEKKLWRKFWQYALDAKESRKIGIKNAQIEAPGTKFVPGLLYTIKIEHDGGMRIDAEPLPGILKGEKID